jgi:hypothetical protein
VPLYAKNRTHIDDSHISDSRLKVNEGHKDRDRDSDGDR